MRKIIFLLVTIGIGVSAAAAICSTAAVIKQAKAGSGPTYTSTLPTTIYLNDKTDSEIRSYYSSLNSLDAKERTGTNLLKNLRPILQDFNYYSYSAVWKIYEITDREWSLSPANATAYGTYDAINNKITGYSYGSASNGKNNPYVHTLYRNRENNGVTVASGRIQEWGDHSQEGGTNREHVWCQSRGFKASSGAEGPAGTDIHHLMSGDGYVNGKPHNNNPYGYVDKSRSYTDSATSYSYCAGNLAGYPLHPHAEDQATTVFEPQDSDKGDIARACFYMVACYNNLSGSETITQFNPNLTLADYATSNSTSEISSANNPVAMGILSDLLEWHKLDPVDEYEIHRNNLIDINYQHNRNPFIDFPEWVDYIWGDKNDTPAKPATDTINGYNADDPTPSSSEPASTSTGEVPASSSSEESSSSEAPSGTETYEKISSMEELEDGSYVIAANIDGDYYALAPASSNKTIPGEEITVSDGTTIEYADGYDFALNIEKSGNGYLISDSNGAYLRGPSESGTALSFGDSSFLWSIAESTNSSRGAFAVNSPIGSRALLFRTAESSKNYYCFGHYASSNRGKQYLDIDLFKYTYEPPYTYADGYKLVTSTAELTDGAKIVIGAKNGENWKLAGAQRNNNIGEVNATLSGQYITSSNAYGSFIIGHVSEYFTFQDTSGNYLYAASSSANYLKRKNTLDDNGKWKIEIPSSEEDNYVASIVASESSNRNVMQYNATSSLFACYDSASQQPIYLFIDVKTALQGFVDSYLHMNDYTSNLGYCNDAEHHYFATAKEQLLAMGDAYIKAFRGDSNFADARARYEAWAEANSASAYQEVSNGAYNAPTAIISGDSPWWVTVGIALITGVSVIVFAAFKRKRA